MYFKKLIGTTSDSGANIYSTCNLFPENIFKLPCAGHRLNLAVGDIFSEIIIIEKIDKTTNERIYKIKNYNKDGLMRESVSINQDQKEEIMKMNKIKKSLNDLISRCRHLVGSFRHGDQLNVKLKEIQATLNYETCNKLVQDVNHRWNSQYDMLDSICVNKDALKTISLLPNISKSIERYVPEDSEFKTIDELCDLLKPLKDLTVLLSGSEYCTINFLFPTIYNLTVNIYPEMNFHCIEIKNLKDELIKNLSGRFKYLYENDIFLAATFLDFQFKKFEFIKNEDSRRTAVDKACIFLKNFYQNTLLPKLQQYRISNPNISSNISNATTNLSNNTNASNSQLITGCAISSTLLRNNDKVQNRTRNKDSSYLLNSIVDTIAPSVRNNSDDLSEEIEEYKTIRFKIPDKDKELSKVLGPMYFFKTYQRQFPILTELARAILCIPATSVPSECVFSRVGEIQDDLRNRLDPAILEMLVFLKDNQLANKKIDKIQNK